jgi:hypothetical protein
MPVYGECCEYECFEKGWYCHTIGAGYVSYYPLAPAPTAPTATAPAPVSLIVDAPEGGEE